MSEIEVDAEALAQARASFQDLVDGAVPDEIFAFGGDVPEIVDPIADYLRRGTKRATVGLVVDYAHEGESLPQVGHRWFVHDSSGVPYAALEVDHVHVAPIDSVTPAFAWDEGEGDRTLERWRDGHQRYFERFLPTIGLEFDWGLPAVFEHFRVIWPDADPELPDPLIPVDGSSLVIRELTVHERPAAQVMVRTEGLPLIGAFDTLGLQGVLAFRPRSSTLEVVGVTASTDDVTLALDRGLEVLQERHAVLVR